MSIEVIDEPKSDNGEHVIVKNFSIFESITFGDIQTKYGFKPYKVFEIISTQPGVIATVTRRYSDFEHLYRLLCMEKPGCIIPHLPPKQILS